MPNYNLGSASDMKRLQKDMEKAIKEKAKETISKGTIPAKCPKCGTEFAASAGASTCPKCGSQINLKLSFDF